MNEQLGSFLSNVKLRCKACSAEMLRKDTHLHLQSCDKMIVECEGKVEGCTHKQERQICKSHEEHCIFAKHVRLSKELKNLKDKFELQISKQTEAEKWKQQVMAKMTTFFHMTRTVERYEVPMTGRYKIVAVGADGSVSKKNAKSKAGKGAEIHATFSLNKNDKLDVLVGEFVSGKFLRCSLLLLFFFLKNCSQFIFNT